MAFIIKRNDLRPRFRVQLTEADQLGATPNNRVPIDLADATSVKFFMVSGSKRIEQPADFVDRTKGIVEYRWASGDTATVGTYRVEFQIMWNGEEPQSFPSEGFFECKIVPDLGE